MKTWTRWNRPQLALAALAALTLAGCGGGAMSSAPAAAPAMPAAPAPAVGAGSLTNRAAADQAQEAPGQNTAAKPNAAQVPETRLVIKNADLALQVESVRDAEAAVRERVGQLGGYIVQSQTNGVDERATITISFRVPAARFDEALGGVQGLAKKVLRRGVSGDDVTEEFVDLESRLRNLQATSDRLLALLAKAEKVEDALAVNTSLTEVQGQIEQIKGRMQFLKQSAAMSTVNVSLEPVPTTPIIAEDSWQPTRVFRRALAGLVEFGQGLAELAIVVLVWSPIWLALLALGLWARRRWQARRSAAAS